MCWASQERACCEVYIQIQCWGKLQAGNAFKLVLFRPLLETDVLVVFMNPREDVLQGLLSTHNLYFHAIHQFLGLCKILCLPTYDRVLWRGSLWNIDDSVFVWHNKETRFVALMFILALISEMLQHINAWCSLKDCGKDGSALLAPFSCRSQTAHSFAWLSYYFALAHQFPSQLVSLLLLQEGAPNVLPPYSKKWLN